MNAPNLVEIEPVDCSPALPTCRLQRETPLGKQFIDLSGPGNQYFNDNLKLNFFTITIVYLYYSTIRK